MKKHLLILVALCLWQSSAWGQNKLSLLFEKQKGLILLYDEKLGETFTNDIERSKEVYPPCSTFKIPNSLIALDLKIIKNKQSHMRWDSKKHPKRKWWPSPWAKDQTLETAFRDSVLWFYQELAQKIDFSK